jgi:MAF protein/2-amino-4-hydroxy-6-hydroxymethyldihydropteridine diphosphokinase
LAILALGSNLGDPRQNVLRAMARLQGLSDKPLLKSSLWQTTPVDCPPGSPVFMNAVVAFVPQRGATPESVLASLQEIEKEFGRKPKKVLNEPRPLDLDLIAFGSETRAGKEFTLPHPRAHQRRFVLQPLSEIAPDLILPGQKKTVLQLLGELPPAAALTPRKLPDRLIHRSVAAEYKRKRRGEASVVEGQQSLDSRPAAGYSCVLRAALKDLPPLILASASPRRVELLRQLSLDFKVVPAEVAEIHHEQMTARELSQLNAYRKARAVAKKFPDALVLAADTLVYLEPTLFGKPATLEEAYGMLERLQGRTHQVVTGLCLVYLRQHRQAVFAETTAVTFHPLDDVKIRRYLNRVNPLDKAGAYAIQEEGDLIVEKIGGSYTNVVGLPMERLARELEAWPRAYGTSP